MNKVFILLWMLFNHVLDDYFLQGCLANLKQKDWWQEHYPSDLYKNDYIMALFMHSLSWSFMIMLPIAAMQSFNIGIPFIALFISNIGIHMVVDNLKANVKAINLISDQIAHICQIFAIWALTW